MELELDRNRLERALISCPLVPCSLLDSGLVVCNDERNRTLERLVPNLRLHLCNTTYGGLGATAEEQLIVSATRLTHAPIVASANDRSAEWAAYELAVPFLEDRLHCHDSRVALGILLGVLLGIGRYAQRRGSMPKKLLCTAVGLVSTQYGRPCQGTTTSRSLWSHKPLGPHTRAISHVMGALSPYMTIYPVALSAGQPMAEQAKELLGLHMGHRWDQEDGPVSPRWSRVGSTAVRTLLSRPVRSARRSR